MNYGIENDKGLEKKKIRIQKNGSENKCQNSVIIAVNL
jgi:hypothetical protein